MKTLLFYLFFVLGLMQPAFAADHDDSPFHIKTIAKGLYIPWGMTFIDKHTLLVTEREGFLSRVNIKTGETTDIDGLPEDIWVQGQGGLLDVAVSPNFDNDGWIYFSYSKNIAGLGTTALARAKLVNASLADWQDIFISESRSRNGVHFGGRITFDNNGHVFMPIGDRGDRHQAQNLSNHAGTIVRLYLNGSIPADNPFINDENALNEIWSYGHRNPQGLFYNTKTRQLWSNEHGPRGGDEINLVKPNTNYGWPVISYGKEYFAPLAVGEGTHKAGMAQPIKVYVPSIAPSSLIQYQGDVFPWLQGDLLSGALKLTHLNRLSLTEQSQAATETRYLDNLSMRIRNIIEGSDGLIYLATDNGEILQLSPITDNE